MELFPLHSPLFKTTSLYARWNAIIGAPWSDSSIPCSPRPSRRRTREPRPSVRLRRSGQRPREANHRNGGRQGQRSTERADLGSRRVGGAGKSSWHLCISADFKFSLLIRRKQRRNKRTLVFLPLTFIFLTPPSVCGISLLFPIPPVKFGVGVNQEETVAKCREVRGSTSRHLQR